MKENDEHISIEKMEKYLAGQLDDSESFELDLHLSICARCISMVILMRNIGFALSNWTAERHGEVARMYQEAVNTMWVRAPGGVFQMIRDIRDQIYKESISTASLLFMGHKSLAVSHLGAETEMDKYTVPLPEQSGLIVINIKPIEGDDKKRAVTISPEIAIQDSKDDMIKLELSHGGIDVDGKESVVVWEDSVLNGRVIAVPNLSVSKKYTLRSIWKEKIWEVPLVLKSSQ